MCVSVCEKRSQQKYGICSHQGDPTHTSPPPRIRNFGNFCHCRHSMLLSLDLCDSVRGGNRAMQAMFLSLHVFKGAFTVRPSFEHFTNILLVHLGNNMSSLPHHHNQNHHHHHHHHHHHIHNNVIMKIIIMIFLIMISMMTLL